MKQLNQLFKGWMVRYWHADKLIHFLVGFLIAENISLVTGLFTYGLIAGFMAGFGKELWDSRDGGSGFDFFDLWATVVGVIFGTLTFYFILQ